MSRRPRFCFSNRNRTDNGNSRSAKRRPTGRAAEANRKRSLERLEQRLVFSAVPLVPVELGGNVVFSSSDHWELRGLSNRHTEIAHSDALELANGTIGITFTVELIDGRQALLSKDAKGFAGGGHLTAMVTGDRVEVRLQSLDRSVTVRSDRGSVVPGVTHQMWVTFGEGGLKLFLDGSLVDAEPEFTQGLVDNDENLAVGANIWARSDQDPDWAADHFRGRLSDFVVYNRALTRAEIALIADRVQPEPQPTAGNSESGLDAMVDTILADPGLKRRIRADEIAGGAEAADEMNRLIVDAIRETGVANDGTLNAADIRDVNDSLHSKHLARWTQLHGDDDGDREDGFHLVRNDGATTHVFGDSNVINTVADGIYHLGFAAEGNRLLNEDGNRNASLEDVAFWLSEFLADDLIAGTLAGNHVDLTVTPSTGKGLDSLVSIITTDEGLIQRIGTSEIVEGARAADAMNVRIVEAIIATGVANDGTFNAADIRDVNAHLRANHSSEWVMLHGDDEYDGIETGFHLVQGDGARTHLFGDSNAVNTVADGIFHLGFGTKGNRLLNEDGNPNASLEDVAHWLNELLSEDLREGSLVNSAVDLIVTPSTGTGLDSVITTITTDRGLILRVPTSEIVDAALAADEMNEFIIEAIRATGVAYDNTFDAGDIRLVNDYLHANHRDRWGVLHGDDEPDSETGFHLVRNDGAKSEWFGDDNAINTVADGIYHLGFGTSGNRLLNEDGHRNASLEDVAFWLNELLADDFATGSLIDEAQVPTEQSVAAGIVYQIPEIEFAPTESYLNVPHDAALKLAQGTVAISFTTESSSGRQTLFSKDHRGYQNGGHLTASIVNGRIEVRLQSDSESQVIKSSSGSIVVGQEHQLMVSFGETDGFRVYLDGKIVGAKPSFTTGIASNENSLVLGASTMWRDGDQLKLRDYFRGELSEFVTWNRQLSLLEVGFAARTLAGRSDPVAAQGTSNSGLDQITELILADPRLNHRIPSDEIVAGAEAADAMNGLIIEAIEATGVANDGKLDAGDARDVNAYLHSKYREEWIILHGDDERGMETGFHLVQGDGATTHIFGDSNLVNTVADGIYHLGFGSRSGRLLNEDGNKNASFKDVAFWLSEFLAEDLQNGSLSNSTVDLAVEGSTRTGLDSLITIIDTDAGLTSRIPTSERVAGARAADAMNDLIIKAIEATGVANDGVFTAGDVRDINAYLRFAHKDIWVELHGDDDEDDAETGFHLVQNDGAVTHLLGNDNAVNTIADGLYHLGFPVQGNRVLNEDGRANASLEDIAYWLNDLLAEDLRLGSLAAEVVDLSVTPSTGTGLDSLVTTIMADPGLNLRIRTSERVEGARAADAMNRLIVEAISATGAANDGLLDTIDIHEINAYLHGNHREAWAELHGDDKEAMETGFHLVQSDGAKTHWFGDENAINKVADGIYHLGFGTSRGRLLNEDGNRNASMEDVAYWLNELLVDDLAAGTLVNEELLPSKEAIESAIVMEVDEILDSREAITHTEVVHQEAFALSQGTIALSFTAQSVDGRQTLFSKDHRGYQNGGHLTAFIENGRVKVRLQSDSQSQVISSDAGSIVPGKQYSLAVSFGEHGGFRVYLDGELVGEKPEFTVGLTHNLNSIVLGASTTHRCGESLNLRDHFVGVVQDFTVYAAGTEIDEVAAPSPALDPPVVDSLLEDIMN